MTTVSEFGSSLEDTQRAALDVLLHNTRVGRSGLPRTAAWGYPEPYTRDVMIASLGILATGNEELAASLRKTLESLASHQSPLGLIPGLADSPTDLGASDTTPLFLLGLGVYRRVSGDGAFLEEAAERAIRWMEYQSPSDRILVVQQPISDWRDEQWVFGSGLYVNTLVYSFLRLFGHDMRAESLGLQMNKLVESRQGGALHDREGLVLPHDPYYALWSHKLYFSTRFDLLGNSLAILSGVASRGKAESIVDWVERSCSAMRRAGSLAVELPPNLFPYIEPDDSEWRSRYEQFNKPGEYHNGGIWPFVCGFYVAALVATGRQSLAERGLAALAELCCRSKNAELRFGFNEWLRAQDGAVRGEDWQLWSASMYLYAAKCVELRTTPLFDEIRGHSW